MSFMPNQNQRLRELQEHLHRAQTATPELMADVIAGACPHFLAQPRSAKTKVIRLIESGAFCDAALALLELEPPQWKFRRIIREDGDWHCSLSKQLALPAELDDIAEGSHENLPLAILTAFVEARRQDLAITEGRPRLVPQLRAGRGYAIICDNFA
jgi:hypothetical protein